MINGAVVALNSIISQFDKIKEKGIITIREKSGSRVNYDKFMENVRHIAPIQYTMYKKEQHYNWHNDVIPYWSPYTRKISGVLMLSDPDEYEGGDLEIIVNGNPSQPEIIKLKKGEIVWFCPTFSHKVHPVTKGTRRTLVLWVEGDRDY
jgi:PKHD-type hydroxylase